MLKVKKESEIKETSEVRSESFDPQHRQPKIIEVKSLDSLTISSIKSNKSQDNEKNTIPENQSLSKSKSPSKQSIGTENQTKSVRFKD